MFIHTQTSGWQTGATIGEGSVPISLFKKVVDFNNIVIWHGVLLCFNIIRLSVTYSYSLEATRQLNCSCERYGTWPLFFLFLWHTLIKSIQQVGCTYVRGLHVINFNVKYPECIKKHSRTCLLQLYLVKHLSDINYSY